MRFVHMAPMEPTIILDTENNQRYEVADEYNGIEVTRLLNDMAYAIDNLETELDNFRDYQ